MSNDLSSADKFQHDSFNHQLNNINNNNDNNNNNNNHGDSKRILSEMCPPANSNKNDLASNPPFSPFPPQSHASSNSHSHDLDYPSPLSSSASPFPSSSPSPEQLHHHSTLPGWQRLYLYFFPNINNNITIINNNNHINDNSNNNNNSNNNQNNSPVTPSLLSFLPQLNSFEDVLSRLGEHCLDSNFPLLLIFFHFLFWILVIIIFLGVVPAIIESIHSRDLTVSVLDPSLAGIQPPDDLSPPSTARLFINISPIILFVIESYYCNVPPQIPSMMTKFYRLWRGYIWTSILLLASITASIIVDFSWICIPIPIPSFYSNCFLSPNGTVDQAYIVPRNFLHPPYLMKISDCSPFASKPDLVQGSLSGHSTSAVTSALVLILYMRFNQHDVSSYRTIISLLACYYCAILSLGRIYDRADFKLNVLYSCIVGMLIAGVITALIFKFAQLHYAEDGSWEYTRKPNVLKTRRRHNGSAASQVIHRHNQNGDPRPSDLNRSASNSITDTIHLNQVVSHEHMAHMDHVENHQTHLPVPSHGNHLTIEIIPLSHTHDHIHNQDAVNNNKNIESNGKDNNNIDLDNQNKSHNNNNNQSSSSSNINTNNNQNHNNSNINNNNNIPHHEVNHFNNRIVPVPISNPNNVIGYISYNRSLIYRHIFVWFVLLLFYLIILRVVFPLLQPRHYIFSILDPSIFIKEAPVMQVESTFVSLLVHILLPFLLMLIVFSSQNNSWSLRQTDWIGFYRWVSVWLISVALLDLFVRFGQKMVPQGAPWFIAACFPKGIPPALDTSPYILNSQQCTEPNVDLTTQFNSVICTAFAGYTAVFNCLYSARYTPGWLSKILYFFSLIYPMILLLSSAYQEIAHTSHLIYSAFMGVFIVLVILKLFIPFEFSAEKWNSFQPGALQEQRMSVQVVNEHDEIQPLISSSANLHNTFLVNGSNHHLDSDQEKVTIHSLQVPLPEHASPSRSSPAPAPAASGSGYQ